MDGAACSKWGGLIERLPSTDIRPREEIIHALDVFKSTTATAAAAPGPSVSQIDLDDIIQVEDHPRTYVLSKIEELVLALTRSIESGEGFSFSVPSRHSKSENHFFEPQLERMILKRQHHHLRAFGKASSREKATMTARLIDIIYEICLRNITLTKRDVYYTDEFLFKKQAVSDDLINDVCCMIGATRSSLNVIASESGWVAGNLKFRVNGVMVDCSILGQIGQPMPIPIDGNRVEDISTDGLFILLVEKDTIFKRLLKYKFYEKFPSIVVTGKGQPAVSTRKFLRKLKMELKLPVFALMDGDPYGLSILSVYSYGSKSMSFDSANLVTPGIKWLGIRASDLQRYKIPEEGRLQMRKKDIKKGESLLQEDFVKKNPKWVEELNLMMKSKKKAKIEALSFEYLMEEYLPLKLQNRDWL